MLELCDNFFTNFWEVNNFEELEKATDSMFLALAEKELENFIRCEKKTGWERLRSEDCTDSFTGNRVRDFFPEMCCDNHKKNTTSENVLSSKRRSSVWKCFCLCSKNYYSYDATSNNLKSNSKALKERKLEQSGGGRLETCRKVLDDAMKITPTHRGFRTKDCTVTTYEQTEKKILSFSS